MESESGSELELARELRQAKAQIAAWWKSGDQEVGPDWVRSGWSVGWPRAKTAVMEAEKEVQQFRVPWAEAWARAEVRTWAGIKATVVRVGQVGREEIWEW